MFDKALHGGLPCRTVTEISGPQSSGKTELILQWTIYQSLPEKVGGLDRGTLYLDSDGTFSVQRYLNIFFQLYVINLIINFF